ncbi:hypothetical protein ABEF95_013025 [Exophiala dermatitidis]
MSDSPQSRDLDVAVIGCGEPNSNPMLLPEWLTSTVAGFIGRALLSGLLQATENASSQLRFAVTAKSEASLGRIREEIRGKEHRINLLSTDNVGAVRASDIVILAVQPEQLPQLLGDADFSGALQGKLIISLVASVRINEIVEILSRTTHTTQHRVARVIPSIGAQIGESMSLLADATLSTDDQNLVSWLFQLVGRTLQVPESLLATATAVSAACHALTVVAADALVDGSVAEGLPRTTAYDMVTQCLRSSSTMLQGHMTIESLKESMSIAEGITINAILGLDRGKVRSGISATVQAAVQHAKTMGSEKND